MPFPTPFVDPMQTQLIGSVTTDFQRPQVSISDLDTCTTYLVTVTASYCSQSATTDESQLINIKDTTPYKLDVLLPDDTCSEWIKMNPDSKLREMETRLQDAGSSGMCDGLVIPCFMQSSWMCTDGDDKKLTFQ